MSTALQKNLRQKLLDKGISANALEKKAGLKPSAVQNILQGKSKRPGADLLLAIAKELGCSVEDLINSPTPITESKSSSKYPWSPDLFIASLKMVQSLLDAKEIEMQKDEVLKIVEEVYLYSIKSSPSIVDEKFADWLVSSYARS